MKHPDFGHTATDKDVNSPHYWAARCGMAEGHIDVWESQAHSVGLPTDPVEAMDEVNRLRIHAHKLSEALQEACGLAAIQSSHIVHPLTCGHDSRHPPLVPEWNGKEERLELRCLDCDYRQLTWPGQGTGVGLQLRSLKIGGPSAEKTERND